MKKYISLLLIAILLLGITGCGYSGPALTVGGYEQVALLYDATGALTDEEINGRYWNLGEDMLLQSKWEARDGFTDYGVGEEYYLSPSGLKKLFPHPQLYDAVAEYSKQITDGRLYTLEDRSILLLKGSGSYVLLGTMDTEGTLTALFLLQPGEIPPTRVPLNHSWNPYAIAPIYDAIFGHRFSIDFCAMVTSIMNGETTFYCSDKDNAYRLTQYGSEIFPPYDRIVANVFFDDKTGMGHIIYRANDQKRTEVLNTFAACVETIINEALQQGDNEITKAVALYNDYVGRITYDYSALTDEKADVSPYRGLTELSGISTSFAPAYAYLCVQVGLNAVTAGGISENGDSHDWTLLTIADQYYYADPTWESTDGGKGLKYFGMTTAQRYDYGKFSQQYTNVANSNIMWGSAVSATNERFADLQKIARVDSIWRADGSASVRGYDASGNYVEIELN